MELSQIATGLEYSAGLKMRGRKEGPKTAKPPKKIINPQYRIEIY